MVAFNFHQIYFFYRLHLSLFWSANLFLRDKSRGLPGGSPFRVRRRGCWCWSWSPLWYYLSAAPPQLPFYQSCFLHRWAAISDSKYSGQFPTIWSCSTLPLISTSTASAAPRSGELSSWPSFGAAGVKPNLVKPLPCHTSSLLDWLDDIFPRLSHLFL